MLKKSLQLFLLTLPFLSYSQNQISIHANIDSIYRKVQFDAMGINSERMFYRTLDENGKMPNEIFEDMMDAEDLVYRWPGGATSNFYHFFEGTAKGYGLSRAEIESVEHPMSCNIPNDGTDACMSFEENTPTNYIYNFLEFTDKYAERFHKKKRVIWLPNIFTFYLHNKDEISLLDQISTIEQADSLMQNGVITEDFYKRLKDVVDVYDILSNYPSIQLEGIEYGNELYFHIPSTGLRYNFVNDPLLWLFNQNQYKNTLKKHMSYYRSIVQFFNSALPARGKKVETAAPVGIISYLGKQANMNQIWNEGIRDSILPLVDAVIHHFYFKINNGPRVQPSTIEDANKADTLFMIKNLADEFIHEKIPKVDEEYEKFFHLTELGKHMWMTEFNTDNGYFDGYLAEWQNTFFHSYFQFEAFMSFVDNTSNTNMIKYAFPHLWVSHENDFDYGAYSSKVELDGSYTKIKRTTYSTYSILGKLAQHNLYKIKDSISNSNNLLRQDLFVKTYFEPSNNNSTNLIGNLMIVFSNKSNQTISFLPQRDINITSDSIENIGFSEGSAEYLYADHIYSGNGYTLLETSDKFTENVKINKIETLASDESILLPGYSIGYLMIPVIDKNIVITSIKNFDASNLELYPNPSNKYVNINLHRNATFKSTNQWKVVDIIGREYTIPAISPNSNSLQIDVSTLPKGMYYFVIQNENGQISKPFAVQ